eukprot:CAMPEP_0206452668 /NCGR_PEP_ID=MMETSP0324_2-20121206/20087_1 /ASSEMBLY_ACC=CAM_ASM_000836 /TAXON_ID=2866 /ORGANISM="Crypthecodinium cohnii, Strain Seligo" /LENGTH=440 /DNA_ID=CAMNT_0053922811 /DNA_START=78 /DNA_END=1400 /DNA_ORIENTATION=-
MIDQPNGHIEGTDVWVEPPRCYIFHYFDDEVFGFMGPSLIHLARALSPCRVATLGLDEESFQCETLDDLASIMTQRIEDDIRENPCTSWPSVDEDISSTSVPDKAATSASERVVLLGYGLGGPVAHRVALRLQRNRCSEVVLILLDSDVCWPPACSLNRMGGYQWLGGRMEAVLLMCRACGLQALAASLVQETLARMMRSQAKAGEEGEGEHEGEYQDDVLMRIFWALAPGGMNHEYFQQCLNYLAPGLDLLNELCASAADSTQVFNGPALMISSSSREFWDARESNARFCSDLQVARSRGSHYCMVQQEHVLSVMKPICEFLVSRGSFGPEPCKRAEIVGRTLHLSSGEASPAELSILSEGDDPDAPNIYLVHDLRPYVTAEWKDRVAELLAPCRVVMPVFNEVAASSRSPQDLATTYEVRLIADIQRSLPSTASTADK